MPRWRVRVVEGAQRGLSGSERESELREKEWVTALWPNQTRALI
jgi:hypothetical protein